MGKLLFLLFFCSSFLGAQHGVKNDLTLLKKPVSGGTKPFYSTPSLNDQKPIQPKRKGAFIRYNPVTLFLTGSMLLYQHVITQQLGGGCLYQRSCSNYAKHAIHTVGLIRGVLLSADRLTRCNTSAKKEVPFIYFDEKGKIIDEPCIHFDH